MMKEKKLSQIILKLHDRAEAAKYDGDSSPPYQEVEMLNFHDEESVVHTVLEDFYAVGALADELTHGFHMEERGYIDRTEVNQIPLMMNRLLRMNFRKTIIRIIFRHSRDGYLLESMRMRASAAHLWNTEKGCSS